MKSVLRLVEVLAGYFFASAALALNPGDRVDNFRLLDQTGASHELYYLSDARAVVLMTYGNGCGIVQKSLPRLREIHDAYKAKGVEFLLIDSNLQDNRDAVARESTVRSPWARSSRISSRCGLESALPIRANWP